MLKTVKDGCKIHPSSLDCLSGGVEGLAQMIDSQDEGRAFFEKSYLTRGMEELLREGLLRLLGQSDQALFQLWLRCGAIVAPKKPKRLKL